MTPHIDQLIRTRRSTVGIYILRDAQLVVRAPKTVTLSYIHDVVARHARWIAEKQRQMQTLAAQRTRHDYREGDRFLLFGSPLTLRFCDDVRTPRREQDRLLLPPADAVRAERLIEGWYKDEARAYFARRTDDFAEVLGVRATVLRLSGAKTRFGSCGPKNSINLVWRLIKAPREVIDYVILHELTHILHRNHGAAFWAQLQAVMPDYQTRRQWLREHATTLE